MKELTSVRAIHFDWQSLKICVHVKYSVVSSNSLLCQITPIHPITLFSDTSTSNTVVSWLSCQDCQLDRVRAPARRMEFSAGKQYAP